MPTLRVINEYRDTIIKLGECYSINAEKSLIDKTFNVSVKTINGEFEIAECDDAKSAGDFIESLFIEIETNNKPNSIVVVEDGDIGVIEMEDGNATL